MAPSATLPDRHDQNDYEISKRPHSDPDKMRVICVGAGASGLCLAYKMEKLMTNYELVCYEKNSSVGGTWFENKYPGVACDIPAHVYTYTFEPNPNWSTFYAYGDEIEEYFKAFWQKHSLAKYIQLNSKVISAIWDEEKGIYDVEIETPQGPKQDQCHVLINACGILNRWKWPNIPGLQSFKGPLLHSAKWDESVDYQGKKVAVIGTGSSAIQIIPKMQPRASELVAFMRSPTWISPAVSQEIVASLPGFTDIPNPEKDAPLRHAQYHFSDSEKKKFREDPEFHRQLRKKIENGMNNQTDVFVAGTTMNDGLRAMMQAEMDKRIGPGHSELKRRLIPQWPPGCRRLTPGDGYLEALVQPNVTRVFDEITEVNEKGLRTGGGVFHEVDILVCATGFDVAFTPGFVLKGSNHAVIQEEWAVEPNCYLGLAAPKFPNYFSVLGPRGPWGNGPLLPSIEVLCEYFITMMSKMQKEHIKSIEVKQQPTAQFNAHVDEWMKGSVWMTNCRSWYKMGTVDGKAWLWPGGTLSYLKTVKEPRYEDYDIHYKNDNQWAFLGNGKTEAEVPNSTSDLSPYIRNEDVPWTI